MTTGAVLIPRDRAEKVGVEVTSWYDTMKRLRSMHLTMSRESQRPPDPSAVEKHADAIVPDDPHERSLPIA